MDLEQEYQDWLDDLYPLDGWNGMVFSVMFKKADPITYELQYDEWREEWKEDHGESEPLE